MHVCLGLGRVDVSQTWALPLWSERRQRDSSPSSEAESHEFCHAGSSEVWGSRIQTDWGSDPVDFVHQLGDLGMLCDIRMFK